MPAGIAITNTDHTPCQLRLMARKCKDANHSCRLLAIAGALIGGLSRTAIAEHAGVGLQTLRDWILRDNGEGPLGLQTRQGQGRPSILDLDRLLFLRDCLETGPPPGLPAWTLSWLRDIIDEVFKVTLSLETIRRVIRRLGFRKLAPRPFHPKVDVRLQDEARIG
ncbi:MAG: winged helix-turn-helix domain-containing protein [Rhodobacteraceae bacterium]|nr:winged helix-turn-helix domain-containing protein [Paracoccaceae bacterium]